MVPCSMKSDIGLRGVEGVPLPGAAPIHPTTGPRPKGVRSKKTHESRLRRKMDTTGHDPESTLPEFVSGNFTMNSVVVGPLVEWKDFATWLANSHWHIVVIRLMDRVGMDALKDKFRDVCSRSGMVEFTEGADPGMDELLASKSMHVIFEDSMFVAHNRYKVAAVAVSHYRFTKSLSLCSNSRGESGYTTVSCARCGLRDSQRSGYGSTQRDNVCTHLLTVSVVFQITTCWSMNW